MSKLIKSLQVRDATFAVGKSWLISLVQVCAIAIKNSRRVAARHFYSKLLNVNLFAQSISYENVF